jgi:hypothetical protein
MATEVIMNAFTPEAVRLQHARSSPRAGCMMRSGLARHARLGLIVLALAGCRAQDDAGERPATVPATAVTPALSPAPGAAEELVRLKAIPFSGPMEFDRHYSEEDLELLSWLAVRALDASAAWTPRAPSWPLYRANIRNDIEVTLRRGWLDISAALRGLAENPRTSLARFYADTLSAEEIGQLTAFHRGAPGRAYARYVDELRRATRRGTIEIDRMLLDIAAGPAGAVPGEARRGLNLRPGEMPPDYAFHVAAAMREALPGAPAEIVLHTLVAAAPPGSEAFRRLDAMLGAEARGAVDAMLASPAAARELEARRRWIAALSESGALLMPTGGNQRGLHAVIADWKALRGRPGTPPRAGMPVDPDRIVVPATLERLPLADPATAAALRRCMPGVSEATIRSLAASRGRRPAGQLDQILSADGEPNMIATRRGVAACLPTTAAGFPVPALNSFAGTIRVIGMGEAETRAWRARIAQEIAASGVSASLVVMADGAAFEATYAVDLRLPARLVYATRFLPPGAYDRRRYRTVVDGAAHRSVSLSSAIEPGDIPLRRKSLIAAPEDEARERAQFRAAR